MVSEEQMMLIMLLQGTFTTSMCEDGRTLTTYLNSLLAVECKAADGLTVSDGRGSGRALQTHSH